MERYCWEEIVLKNQVLNCFNKTLIIMNSEQRPKIPDPIKRKVRQNCGFGCVICGLPLYEYDHFKPYAQVMEHKVENLFLLCPKHHTEKTKGLLDIATYESYCVNPVNIINGLSAPYDLHFEGSNMKFIVGECNLIINDLNPISDELTPLVINNERIIGFRFFEGILLLTIKLYDEKNNLILLIEDNEMIYNTGTWDIIFEGRNMKLREAARNILLDIDFLPPETVRINEGRFYKDGYELIVTDGKMISKNITVKIKKVENIRVLFSMGNCSDNFIGAMHNGPIPENLL